MTWEELKDWRESLVKKRGTRIKGYSQSDIARELGVPVRTYQNWEQGRSPVPSWVEIHPFVTKKRKG